MKKEVLFYIVTLVLFASSCKESTVMPYDGGELELQNTNMLTEDYWIVTSTSDPANNSPSITKFKSDGSATVRFFSDSQTKTMTWKFNSNCDSLILTNQYQTVAFHIDELSNAKLKISLIKNHDTSYTEFCKVDKNYQYAVGGKIHTSLLTGLTNDMSLAAVWHCGDSLGYDMRLSGRGKINISEKTFYIGFDNALPDEACVLAFNQNPVDYKFALGYIMLFEKNLSDIRYADFLNKIELQHQGCVGLVPDRCIAMMYNSGYGSVYLKGEKAAWINDLPQGWCMTQLTAPNGTLVKNYWKETYPYDLELKVGNVSSYTFPVWY